MKTRSALVVCTVLGLGLCGVPQPANASFPHPVVAAPGDAVNIEERVASLRKSAIELRAKGDFEGAVTACRAAVLLDNRNAEVYADLGEALEAKGLTDEAMRCYRESVGEQPGQTWGNSRMEEGDLHLRYAIAAVRHGFYDEAVRAYMLAQERLPDGERACLPNKFGVKAVREDVRERQKLETAAHAGLGLHYAAAGRLEAAQEQVNAALALTPNDGTTLFCAGNLLMAQGKKVEAAAAWQKAVASDNGTARGWAKAALAKN